MLKIQIPLTISASLNLSVNELMSCSRTFECITSTFYLRPQSNVVSKPQALESDLSGFDSWLYMQKLRDPGEVT